MKVPISWLKEYVDFDDTPQGLADKLTFSGIEVEGIQTLGGDFPGIVVGEVVSVMPHPNADRLTICRVTDGDAEVQVVCGAPNVASGMKAPFAPVGVALPDGTKLKKTKIRQVESFGMLLAEDELGLSDDHSGIMALDAHWTPGTPLAEVLGPPETVLDLEITPNRPDCLSIIGVAREVAALYGTTLNQPGVTIDESSERVESLTRVDVMDTETCPRYTARIISGVTVGPSPTWMQSRLTWAGIRPINNVVDITNYVMLETGHPLHAFDQALLTEGRIVVRRAAKDEKLKTLDDMERTLTADMLVIADATHPVAVAGVMGGTGSEIRDETSVVLLESACFDPLRSRTTSRALALSTESSYRFERGVDAETVEWASRRAAALMAEHAGGQIAKGVIDSYPKSAPEHAIRCGWDFVRGLTGMSVSNERIEQIMTTLELTVVEKSDSDFIVRVPSFRKDLERAVDLVEEVARIHGLEHVPTPPPRAELVPDADGSAYRARKELTDHCAALGLTEIMNYSLTAPALLDLFDPTDAATRVVLPHPISADQSVLRPSLIPHMLETIGRNHARQIPEVSFFETGRTYQKQNASVQECDRLAIGLLGPVGRGPYDKRKPVPAAEMFTWLKGILESLCEAQRISNWEVQTSDHPYFENGQSVKIYLNGQEAGWAGLIRSEIRREWRITSPVAVAELDMNRLLREVQIPQAKAVPVYPAISRDMALVLDAGITHADVLAVTHKNAPKELEKIELFDIFEGGSIGAGKKSMAYSLTYRSTERTLTDEEANGFHDQIKDAIKKELKVMIREGE